MRRAPWLMGLLLLLAQPVPADDWANRLEPRLAAIERGLDGELGVHVRRLEDGDRFGWRDRESWYLASLVKVPVAVELLARVEAGELSLDDTLTLHQADYVDGAGPTNWAPPGDRLRLETLLRSMLRVSDNTATDMLIRRLGLDAVNRRARALAGRAAEDLGPITSLVDVRRHVYAGLHPDAYRLGGMDFIALRKRDGDAERLAWFRHRLDLPDAALRLGSLDDAFAAYYAEAWNSGSLVAVAEQLETIARGRALGPEGTTRLLTVMARTTSGDARLRAGLGPGIGLAHKTGTQHRRACDAGIATLGRGEASRRLVVVACVRGEADTRRAEQALAEVGRAIRAAGL